MKNQLFMLALVLMSVGVYSKHLTLEGALNFDSSSLSTPECATQVEIEGTIKAIEEWIQVLSNPEDLAQDILDLSQVRELIVSAQDSIEAAELEPSEQLSQGEGKNKLLSSSGGKTNGQGTFGPTGQGTFGPTGQGTFGPTGQGTFGPTGQGNFVPEFVQTNSQIKMNTKVVHKIYAEQMEEIMELVQTFNEAQGSTDELVELADGIIAAIDALISELQDLQNDSEQYESYINTLTTKINEIRAILHECYPDTKPLPDDKNLDGKVSSATLDDFDFEVYVPPVEKEFTASSGELNDTVNSGKLSQGVKGEQLAFIQKSLNNRNYKAQKKTQHNKKIRKQQHIRRN